MSFAFEKLQVYQRAVSLADAVCTLTRGFPRGYFFLADQLNRAALSIAAGAGALALSELVTRKTRNSRRSVVRCSLFIVHCSLFVFPIYQGALNLARGISLRDFDAAEKYVAMIKETKEAKEKGQPVLLGTTSIEKSELLSQMLSKEGIEHNVLNARQHEREAQIVADAGRYGTVTIATNMAGRGTDIQLGGNVEMNVLPALAENPEADPAELRAKEEARTRKKKKRFWPHTGPV